MIWEPLALAGLVEMLVAPALGVLIYRSGPQRAVGRFLALMLIAEGFSTGLTWGIAPLLADDPQLVAAADGTQFFFWSLQIAATLAFLSTLPVRLVAPLRSRPGRILVRALIVLLPLAWLVLGDIGRSYSPRGAHLAPYTWAIYYMQLGVSLLSLLVAIAAVRETPRGSQARRQAAWYAAAFVWFDVMWGYLIVASLYSPLSLPLEGIAASGAFGTALIASVGPLISLVFICLLAYGILQAQLFDIDLRIKAGLRRGTVTGLFVAGFFVANEIAQLFLADALGPIVGALAMGAMVFALHPLQRVAARVTDVAMPGVRDSDEYRTVRKRAVYRSAFESAMEDGSVTQKERAMLATLAQELGLGPRDVYDIEASLTPSPGTA